MAANGVADAPVAPAAAEPAVVAHQPPPYSEATDTSNGITCYICDKGGFKSWLSITEHVRSQHKVTVSSIKGTFLYTQFAIEAAARQKKLYAKKKLASAAASPNAKKDLPSEAASSAAALPGHAEAAAAEPSAPETPRRGDERLRQSTAHLGTDGTVLNKGSKVDKGKADKQDKKDKKDKKAKKEEKDKKSKKGGEAPPANEEVASPERASLACPVDKGKADKKDKEGKKDKKAKKEKKDKKSKKGGEAPTANEEVASPEGVSLACPGKRSRIDPADKEWMEEQHAKADKGTSKIATVKWFKETVERGIREKRLGQLVTPEGMRSHIRQRVKNDVD